MPDPLELMDMKTLTGPSIQAALATAREELGSHVVLIESTPATDSSPAQIAVMVDEPASEAAAPSTSRPHVPKPPSQGASKVPGTNTTSSERTGYGYAGGSSGQQTTAEHLRERFEGGNGDDSSDPVLRQEGTGRGRLFPSSKARQEGPMGGGATREQMVEARHDRLQDHLRREGGSGRTVNVEQWAGHPLFSSLVDDGMRPATIAELFEDLEECGIDLEETKLGDLRWAFSQVLCRRIDVSSATVGEEGLVVIGPGGAGKTSLILKMAVHDGLFGDRDPAIIHLLPEPDRGGVFQNPTDLYRRFGLPVQGVRTADEMEKALRRVEGLGPVIVDTPSLPLPLDEARPVLRRYERLLQPLLPMDVHLVMSANQAYDSVNSEVLEGLPLTPSTTALTHLDEAGRWGRAAEWLLELGLPVQYVSDGPQVPEGARAFSLQWFVEDFMELE